MDRTSEELAERQRIHDLVATVMDQEAWRIADLFVGKRDDQLFGKTEFALRDIVHRVGAMVLEATVNDRKKGGTKAVASSAQSVQNTHVSTVGPHEPSEV